VRLLCNVEVIDNTNGQIIDFREWLDSFPDKQPGTGNDWGSAKHCYTVQWLCDKRRNPFILMDSDVLVKRDIPPFWDSRYVYVGERRMHRSRFGNVERVLPFLCYVNVPVMKHHGITYYNAERMFCLTRQQPGIAYDTGCWFLEDCLRHKVEAQELDADGYILHLGHASWRDMKASDWLSMHRELWQ
jgi:hypothetical protein